MSGLLVHVGATVMCQHGGNANAITPNPRVTVGGQATVLLNTVYTVAGCAMPPPTAGNGPCVTGQFLIGTVRVTSNHQPLIIKTSSSVCTPTGTPLNINVTQTRVTAT